MNQLNRIFCLTFEVHFILKTYFDFSKMSYAEL